MILDCRTNPRLARLHDVLDVETGENLNHLGIIRADDAKGTMTVLAVDEAGEAVCNELGWQTTAEVKRAIRIVVKPECQGAVEIPKVER